MATRINTMTTFNIHRAVGLPKSREQAYPFAELEVGDAFEFQVHCIAEVRSAAQWVGKKHNRKFSVRKHKANGTALCIRVA